MKPNVVGGALIIALTMAAPASAQYDAGAAMDMTGMGIYAMEDAMTDAAKGEDGSKDKTVPQASQTASLEFQPDPLLRSQILNAFGQSVPAVSAFMRDSRLIEIIEEDAMAPHGLSANNVADAFALWWTTAWIEVNQSGTKPSTKMMLAVQNQISKTMNAGGKVASMADHQKQQMADNFMLQAFLIIFLNDQARDNPAQQAQVARQINEGAKVMGLDLTKMTLTENGFVPR